MNRRVIRRGHPEWCDYLDEIGSLEPISRLHLEGMPLRAGEGAVAIVGARRPTIAGIEAATRIATGLAEAGLAIVSGMAVGIDAAAHRAALEAGGYTIGVLGCGLDIDYPSRNARLRAAMRERGTLVTEYEAGAQPQTFHFPARNRIIAALSTAVVFVEGTTTSGGRITMSHAIDANRATFAVPGSIRNPLAAGPNELIRTAQATLVTDVSDILDELAPGTLFDVPVDPRARSTPSLSDAEARILGLLDDVALPADRIRETLEMTGGEVSLALARLEAAGYVQRGFRGVSIASAGARVRASFVSTDAAQP